MSKSIWVSRSREKNADQNISETVGFTRDELSSEINKPKFWNVKDVSGTTLQKCENVRY